METDPLHDTAKPDTGAPDTGAPDDGALLVAGLGASAGGVEALEAFFAGLPEIDGVALVVILHLAPDEESRLADVLEAGLPLPVTQATEAVTIERGHVYVHPGRSGRDRPLGLRVRYSEAPSSESSESH